MSSKNKSSAFRKPLQGLVKRHPDGFGFFIPDDKDQVDVYIPKKWMSGIMSNDVVTIKAIPEPGGNRFRGEILEVVKRSTVRVAGQYFAMTPDKGMLHDKSFAWGSDLIVDNPERVTVNAGDWVAVQITDYPDSAKGFRGRILQVIGDILDPLNDSPRILHVHHIPDKFSNRALKEADNFAEEVDASDIKGRKDLRQLAFITIDGKTAKDFDDAVYVESLDKGFKLFVAIADVSHYVKPGMAIDDEAYDRGTSTYFPNFVAPMLPAKLSDHLCSLRPKVDRLALVAEMDFDFQGNRVQANFYETVINSKARVTYGEAQETIDGRTPEGFEHVSEVILRAADLAKIFMNKRFREGSLNLEIPETEIEVDETGDPVDIMQAERLFSHKLIEELMLAANVAVAEFLNEHERPVLFRIHEEPNPEAVENLQAFLQNLGFQKRLSGGSLQKKITKALEEFSDHPQQHILHILALRSMAQAKYSPQNVGHFGLGFENYCHFTSPIRRYPDLIVHRVLKSVICPQKGYPSISQVELDSAGVFLSACEQRSVKAERHIHAIKKARFMSRFIGQEFDGTISSVTKFGIFVLLRRFNVDGLVRSEDLGSDRYEFDEENLQMVGRKSGMTFTIGDSIKVQVAATNIDEGQIDFIIAGGEDEGSAVEKEVQSFEKRRSPKDDSRNLRKTRFSGRRRKG